jgi:hypothetical protein
MALVLLLAAMPQLVWAQAAWEFSPYDVKVWFAAEPLPELGSGFQARLAATLKERAEAVFPAAWRLTATVVPPSIRPAMLTRLEAITAVEVKAAESQALAVDKIFLVAIRSEGNAYDVTVREVDGRTRQSGPPIRRAAPQRESIPLAAWDAIVDSFAPLVRIESVDPQTRQVGARLRAGGLILDPASPALIQPGDVLKPVIRRNDKNGEPAKNGIQAVEWTLLVVSERVESLLHCQLQSGYRMPIPVRGGTRTERLAYLAKTRYPSTRIVLTARSDETRRLSGYEVFVKGQGNDQTELLGVTDWQGAVELPRADVRFRLLYVRNGGQLLARLPVAPGFERELVAATVEDDSRLQAEGFVLALQGRTMDLVARREILALLIRSKIKEKKVEEARALLERFRKLETRADLIRDLDAQLDLVKSADPITQKRIDKLFGDARDMLQNKHLDPGIVNQLERELETGRVASAAQGN